MYGGMIKRQWCKFAEQKELITNWSYGDSVIFLFVFVLLNSVIVIRLNVQYSKLAVLSLVLFCCTVPTAGVICHTDPCFNLF